MKDNHGRTVNYLRLAVTDRCNLRCFYCMPEEGINYVPRKELLSFEEMIRIVKASLSLGVSKLRLTGGEPFIRKDIMDFIREVCRMEGMEEVNITTNGVMTKKYLPELEQLGIRSINLSLDTLNRERFTQITRRDDYDNVRETLDALLKSGIRTKINMVVMGDINAEDIIPMIDLTKYNNVSVRFIEEMPFNGEGDRALAAYWNYKKILDHIQSHFSSVNKLKDPPFSTSVNYKVQGFKGDFGIIAAYSRTFCGTCNRLRVTPQGTLKTCLYDSGVMDLKALMRNGASDQQLAEAIFNAVQHRDKDGFEAEKNRFKGLPIQESMSTIGG